VYSTSDLRHLQLTFKGIQREKGQSRGCSVSRPYEYRHREQG
jgi:hypothetical protein